MGDTSHTRASTMLQWPNTSEEKLETSFQRRSIFYNNPRRISADEENVLHDTAPERDPYMVHSPPSPSPPPRTPRSQILKSLLNIRISHPIDAMQIICPSTTAPRDTPRSIWPFDNVENSTDIVDLGEHVIMISCKRTEKVYIRCARSRGHLEPRTASVKRLLRPP